MRALTGEGDEFKKAGVALLRRTAAGRKAMMELVWQLKPKELAGGKKKSDAKKARREASTE